MRCKLNGRAFPTMGTGVGAARPTASPRPRGWGGVAGIAALLLACAAPNPAFEGPADASRDGTADGRRLDGPVPPAGHTGTAGTPANAGGGATMMLAGAAGTVSGYDFELGVEGWLEVRNNPLELVRTTGKAATGSGALEVRIDTAGRADRYPGTGFYPALQIPAGSTLRARVWVPLSAALQGVQPFVVAFPDEQSMTAGGAVWTGKWHHYADLPKDRWTELTVVVPPNFGILELGVQFQTSGPWRGSVWIDSVSW